MKEAELNSLFMVSGYLTMVYGSCLTFIKVELFQENGLRTGVDHCSWWAFFFLLVSHLLSLSLSVEQMRNGSVPKPCNGLTMEFFGTSFLLAFILFLAMLLPQIMAGCPMDLIASNFTIVASMCKNNGDRGKCCRYINAIIAVSAAHYANETNNLGVPSDLSESCLESILHTMVLYGVPRNATAFCGFGTKISVNYECKGRKTVTQMLQSADFPDVIENCKMPLSEDTKCRTCINSSMVFLRHIVGIDDNITLSTCRDATFVSLVSQVDPDSAAEFANCFFGVQGLNMHTEPSPNLVTPDVSPSSFDAACPSQQLLGIPISQKHHSYHLTLAPGIGIAVTAVSVLMLLVLIVLVRRKSRQLDDSENADFTSSKTFSVPRTVQKIQGSFMFQKFSYKDIKKATDDFRNEIGRGGFGTTYKAQFEDGLVAAVKRINKVLGQGENAFCREIELLARLHHRHLVALRGFSIRKQERFLIYEYMANGSLTDHLHSISKSPLSWRMRMQIAIDVANALEYLHFYCDPPLCHRDIKSSNILLDEYFVAKVADFGLAHASKDVSVCFEPVNTDVLGTPGYIDPEYVVTQELTEKSDVYSYGVLLLEIVTGRLAILDGKSLVEWSQFYMQSESTLPDLVDPRIKDSFDLEQLHAVVSIVKWCTDREGRDRPSIKQVLQLLYDSSDPMQSGFIDIMDIDEDYEHMEERGRTSRGKMHSGDVKCLASSSSTSRSHCSRSFLLETSSSHSPS